MNNRPLDCRRGFSLVEMLLVITLSTLIMGTVIALVISLQRWDRDLRGGLLEREQTARLAEMLRRDIRRATDLDLTPDGQLVITSAAGGTTRYDLNDRGVTRVSRSAPGGEQQREQFAIGPVSGWTVEWDRSGRRPLAIVALARPRDADPTTAELPRIVDAALGADLAGQAADE